MPPCFQSVLFHCPSVIPTRPFAREKSFFGFDAIRHYANCLWIDNVFSGTTFLAWPFFAPTCIFGSQVVSALLLLPSFRGFRAVSLFFVPP